MGVFPDAFLIFIVSFHCRLHMITMIIYWNEHFYRAKSRLTLALYSKYGPRWHKHGWLWLSLNQFFYCCYDHTISHNWWYDRLCGWHSLLLRFFTFFPSHSHHLKIMVKIVSKLYWAKKEKRKKYMPVACLAHKISTI